MASPCRRSLRRAVPTAAREAGDSAAQGVTGGMGTNVGLGCRSRSPILKSRKRRPGAATCRDLLHLGPVAVGSGWGEGTSNPVLPGVSERWFRQISAANGCESLTLA